MLVECIVKLLDGIGYDDVVLVMLQGLIVYYLLCCMYLVKVGDMILIYVVVGGVGLFVCQWVKVFGVIVIGMVGFDEKVEFVKVYGCDYLIVYMCENFMQCVKVIMNGVGVLVVYDLIGKDIYIGLFDCFVLFGYFVSFGNVLGLLLLIDLKEFLLCGLLFFMWLMLFLYIVKCVDFEVVVVELFDVILLGKVKISINQCYLFVEVGCVYVDLEVCKIIGLMIFVF